MSINTTPNMSNAPRGFGRNALLATIGGGVVLMAAVGAGLWARSDSHEASAPAEAVAVQPSSNALVAPASTAQVLKSPGVTWLYIVGSEAEAATLRNAASSVPGSPSEVILVGSKGEANYAVNLWRDLNTVRVPAGLPEVRVIVAGSLALQ